MKNINVLLKGAAKLNKQEMKNVKGGVSREQYCAELAENFQNNADSWDAGTIEGWWHGWSNNCK